MNIVNVTTFFVALIKCLIYITISGITFSRRIFCTHIVVGIADKRSVSYT